jgi:carboxyl-terminal processing protease
VAVGQVKDVPVQIPDPARPDRAAAANSGASGTAASDSSDADMVDVVGMRLTKTVQMIRGPKGTVVKLVMIPADAGDDSVRKTVTLVRDEIKLEDKAAKAKLVEVPRPDAAPLRLGVIDLDSFYAEMAFDGNHVAEPKSTTVDVAKLLKKLMAEKVDGVILDLRRNGGGSLEEAITLTGLFIKKGPVVQVKNSFGDMMTMEKPLDKEHDYGVFYDGPLVVLTSRFSASASEILAGALQDYGRALIVGDSATHGKGTVQTIVNLAPRMEQYKMAHTYDPGALKLTVKKFYRPSGASTQKEGVRPDIVLPSVNNYAKLGEAALENALEWDEVHSAEFTKVNDVKPFLATLRKLDGDRVASEQDFAYVREDITAYKKAIAEKSVSLNEASRRREKIENEAKNEARLHEELLRPPSRNKIYELSLKKLDSAGLPVPVALTNNIPNPPETASADPAAHDDEAEAAPRPPSIDVGLEETERVLADYINLWKSETRAVTLDK